LHEKGIRYLILFTLVIPETWTVVECEVLDDGAVGDGGLGVLVMTYFNVGGPLAN
jgi:hypothetical protein